ncbi:MAG: outer-membrane lipoprotein carrier protein LolA [Gemmatimonadetes bacterium]|nr:outer-membrane lipoprotein carrier protein LolA [Gemmatimonadota bacterium]
MKTRSILFAGLGGLLLLVLAVVLLRGGGEAPPADARPVTMATPDRTADGEDSVPYAGERIGSESGGAPTAEERAGPAGESPSPASGTTPATASGDGATDGSAAAPSTGSAPAVTAPAAPAQEGVEEILRATARRYEDVRALQADFEQQLTNALMGRTTRSTGTLYQRQPDRFLMRFSQPAGDVIVSDGEYFWIYYPSADPKQVIRSSRGAGGLDLRSQFVGDPVRRFDATSHGTETVRGRSTHVLTLNPRESVGYRRLKVWIDAEDHLVRRFELTEENGNVRRFDLTDLRVNPTLPDDLFRFEPPAGAVVVSR